MAIKTRDILIGSLIGIGAIALYIYLKGLPPVYVPPPVPPEVHAELYGVYIDGVKWYP